jgi:hypothetical protein
VDQFGTPLEAMGECGVQGPFVSSSDARHSPAAPGSLGRWIDRTLYFDTFVVVIKKRRPADEIAIFILFIFWPIRTQGVSPIRNRNETKKGERREEWPVRITLFVSNR